MAHGVDTSQLIEPLRINSIMTDSLVRAFLRASALTSIGETLEMALLVRDINILSVNRCSQVVSQIGCQTRLISCRVHKDPISSSRRSHSFSRLPPWMLGTNVALSLFFYFKFSFLWLLVASLSQVLVIWMCPLVHFPIHFLLLGLLTNFKAYVKILL